MKARMGAKGRNIIERGGVGGGGGGGGRLRDFSELSPEQTVTIGPSM